MKKGSTREHLFNAVLRFHVGLVTGGADAVLRFHVGLVTGGAEVDPNLSLLLRLLVLPASEQRGQ
jgi:hypothetical protein